MKKAITIVIFFLCIFDLKPIDSKVLSKSVLHKILKLVEKETITYKTYQINVKLYSEFLNEIDFVNLIQLKSENDTLFIIMKFGEFYDVSNFDLGILYNKKEYYFSKQDTTKYENYKKKNDFKRLILYQADKKYGLFPTSTINYVNKWNPKGLLQEYKKNRLLGGSTVVAVRIIFAKHKYIINCFSVPELYIHRNDYDPMYTGKDIYFKQVIDVNNLPFSY